jgi:predicted 3-demethylubiquinone-9 3-methyltransferase (glyoxalase superfamily)
MQSIKPSLVFNNQAEQAAEFYVSVFKNARILNKFYYGEGEPGPAGTLSMVVFELLGEKYVAANGGDTFKFEQGLSMYVNCDTQEEIDYLYERLSEGGEQQPCGWLIDKFGVSWQIAPAILEDMMEDHDSERLRRTLHAFWAMKKLDIKGIQEAYAQGERSTVSR